MLNKPEIPQLKAILVDLFSASLITRTKAEFYLTKFFVSLAKSKF